MIITPRIYISGPFTDPNPHEVENNIRRAEAYILPIAEACGCPVCPHTMYRNFNGTLSYQWWIRITKALLEPCEAIMLLPDWERSKGSFGERQDSLDCSRPTFYSVEFGVLPPTLLEWLKRGDW